MFLFVFLCISVFPSSSNNVPKPQYSIIRDPVDGELPEFLVCEVQLPLVVSEQQPLHVDSVLIALVKIMVVYILIVA